MMLVTWLLLERFAFSFPTLPFGRELLHVNAGPNNGGGAREL